ncbi:MAG: hypothetical protein A2504_02855 [Bdellovibrionales bacterium RIFOXYD12_FULL_39_22]|nr:MAG: hypothetical protein A2385_05570 [Bdellovibrionales bacterium RIFOXYB1_FULL_39_21]OFZ42225.1 MAG: hypothetical protein A2485_15600 [Bdellovibrionales bacterium RIFOXYC12_FULL_39_17]OFZ46683.1 MAG: hypothetical protein A2404_04070 [Bdellovibrionales bacterium RIFOXYC1_FULL_39_130]OFZ74219.1 MAG: hypothetical protein A2451_02095 [Bdellovibrionales bacterium RIFOXYC2_FULL_39_8]OFZ76040.1 MAG: hypothetical protein A2560_03080 [Bdellovibrionales bacterium RIFOXYD1_FULL_39_84]OFZ93024.1 MAG:
MKKGQEKFLLGLDIGGTKVEGVIIKISSDTKNTLSSHGRSYFPIPSEFLKTNDKLWGEIIIRKRIPTERDRGYMPVMKDIAGLIKSLCEQTSLQIDDLLGIGAGMPGTIDPEKQIMLNGNSQIFINQNFTYDLCQLLASTPRIHLENDASCFALSEVMCGVGHDFYAHSGLKISQQVGIGIILGTGVGGGIIVDGKILSGRFGGGGEVGHTTLVPGGQKCYCGNFGCAEQYLSGPAMEAIYFERSNIKAKSAEIFSDNVSTVAQEVRDFYLNNLAIFLRNLTSIFDPDYFVLGGGVSNQPLLYNEGQKRLWDSTFLPQSKPLIYQHKLGDSAGVIGAAILLLTKNLE